MTTTTDNSGERRTSLQTKVFRVFIRATPEAVWAAVTTPEWTARYGYRSPWHIDLRVGGALAVHATEEMMAYGGPEVIIDGQVLEVDPPHRLVQTYRTLWDDEARAEGVTTLTYELKPFGDVTRLTVVHDVTDAPRNAALLSGDVEPFGGGWPEILSDLKSLLETGSTMRG